MTRPDIPVTISGDPRKFEGALARMRTATRTTAADLTASFLRFQSAMAGPAAAATAAVTGLAAAMKASVESVAELSRQSRMAGMDVEAFQGLKFAAEQNNIAVDVLADGLKELSLRADEFVQTGGGGAAEAFQRLGYGSEQLAEKLKDPSALFVEIIGRMQEFDRAARLRIGDELFGGSAGERFVELVDKGAEGLREQIQLANELGLVMNREMVAQAEEVDKKFNIIAATVGTKLKGAIVEAVSAWAWFLDTFHEFEQQQNTTLQGRQVQIGKERLDLERQILEAQEEQRSAGGKLSPTAKSLGFEDSKNANLAGYTGQIDEAKRKLAELAEEDARITNVINSRVVGKADQSTPKPTRDLSGDYIREYREELAKSNTERKVAAELEKILSDASSKGVKLSKDQAEALARETVARQEQDEAAKKSASTSERAATATEKERERIREIITELENEIAVVWKSDQAKRALEGSRMAGSKATTEERNKIIELNEELFQQEEARNRLTDQIAFERDLTRSAIDDMKSALEDGKITWQEMGDMAINVLSRISDKLLDDVLDSIFKVNNSAGGGGGGGILASLFGGLFGGGKQSNFVPNTTLSAVLGYGGARAAGGDVSPGRLYEVNENEREFFAPSQHGRIYAPSKMQGLGSEATDNRSVVEIRLGEGLVGNILQQSQDQSVQLIRSNNDAQANYRQNGGT